MGIKATVSKKDEQRAFRNLDYLLKEVSHQSFMAAKEAGNTYTNLVKLGIGARVTPPFVGTPWEPLSDRWKKAKKSHKDEFWMETAGIWRNTRTFIVSKALLLVEVFAGIRKADDAEAFERTQRNEFGIGLGPARPLFLPALEVFSRKVGKGQRKLKKDSAIWARFKRVVNISIRKVYK